MKKVISLMLAIIMLCMAMPSQTQFAKASVQSTYEPYVNIEYDYSTSVTCGTIRYISQITTSSYFNWNYWPASYSLRYYSTPGDECGTACISMALSYVGVNKTPYDILTPYDGETMFCNWGDATHSYPSSISDGISYYINGLGKYSPVVIKLPGGGANGKDHYIMIMGKASETEYQVLDPAINTLGTATVNNSTVTYNSRTYTVSELHQWYNPNASISYLGKCTFYPAYCHIEATANTSAMSLPCSNGTDSESIVLESVGEGTTYVATALILNDQGNHWYQIETSSGQNAYVPSSEMNFNGRITTDITISNADAPSGSHTQGAIYYISGDISSVYNDLTRVCAYVYSGFGLSGDPVTGGYQDLSVNTYSLSGSAVDNKVEFNKLPEGNYTYIVSAEYTSYYAIDEKTRGTITGTTYLFETYFTVTASGISPDNCTHSYSGYVSVEPTCTTTGLITHSCSICGDTYSETLETIDHNYDGWRIDTPISCTTDEIESAECTMCGDPIFYIYPAYGHYYEYGYCSNCGQADPDYNCQIVSYGKSYVADPVSAYSYGGTDILFDDGYRLTDGDKNGRYPFCEDYSAWNQKLDDGAGGKYVDVTIDLGTVTASNVYRIHSASSFWGVAAPHFFSVWGSNDGSNFELIESSSTIEYVGTTAFDDGGVLALVNLNSMTITVSEAQNYRYISFHIYSFGDFLWLDETEVILNESLLPQEPTFVRGDVDGNGEVKTADYIILKRILLGVKQMDTLKDPETAYDRCDVNANGEVKTNDYLLLKRALLGSYTIQQ